MKSRTRVNHPDKVVLPPGNTPLVAPIYQSVKFESAALVATEAAWSGRGVDFHYSRAANPSVGQLEGLLAELQQREACVAVSTGIAAVSSTLLALLGQGDHVLSFVESYGPTRGLLSKTLARFGVTTTLLSLDDHAGIERVLSERPTRLVWFESPTNPVVKIADIPFITAAARRHGALTVLDNTFAGIEAHGEFDIDVFVHSLTKSVAGHGDVMGGAVIGSKALMDRVRAQVIALGPTLDPHAAFLIMRGLKTYPLRRAEECRVAHAVATWLCKDSRIARVRYPGLESDPGYARAIAQMPDAGSVVCIDLAGTPEQTRLFADSLKFFSIVASLGSTESLIVPGQLLQPLDLTVAQRALSEIGPTTCRLSFGLEDPEDLIEDLQQALGVAFPAR
jgi:cystathionine beta-lyase/cystathionine gamma-synthase